MKTKKRLFIANDASYISSGYGVYGKELLTRLHNTGKYEIAELGCYADVDNPENKSIPWKFYPNAVKNDDTRVDAYKNSGINQFGNWRFNRCLLDFKPHIVFDIRDYWMSAYQETSPLKKYFHWILMPTVDSAPQKLEWLYTFANADIIVPYTEWAKKVLSHSCGNKINLFPKIANAGIDPKEFYQIENRSLLKKQFFGSENVSIIGTVMRNQKRKLFDDLILAYRQYLNTLLAEGQKELYDNSYLYLHTSYPEESGWDLPSILYQHNMLDKTYITYICRNCKQYFPAKYQNSVVKCRHCNNMSAVFSSVVNGVDNKQLNEIYNLFDLYVQCAICEGFGMPQVEAGAAGVPIASVEYSAMAEIAHNLDGFKIPVSRLFREMESNAYRAYPDIEEMVRIFYKYFVKYSDDERNTKRISTREKCINLYTWDNVAKVWDECFETVDIGKKLSWDTPNPNTSKHTNNSVPGNLNPRDFVEYICANVINDSDLMKTAYVQCLIRDLASGLVSRNGSMMSFNYKNVVESLEQQLKHKLMMDEIINKQSELKKEDYLLL